MKKIVVLDCEVYPNYFLVAFKGLESGKVLTFEAKGAENSLDEDQVRKLRTTMQKYMTFGFNSRNYDMPIILAALKGKSCEQIHKISDWIINGTNKQGWMTMKAFGLSWHSSYEHFDIQEVAPGVRISLKLYGGRMHSRHLQDLPIAPGSMLTDAEMQETLTYCINDLDTTIDLYRRIEPQIKLRQDMSEQYGVNLLSKSDAQIAEQVIKSELEKKSPGKKFYAPKIPPDKTMQYKAPDFVKFNDPQLIACLEFIESHDFTISKTGSVDLPKELQDMVIKLGGSEYQMGIGGLHSKEKGQTIEPSENQRLIDKDVASFYPATILNQGLYPKQLGEHFLNVYKTIVDERLEAKRSGNKVVNQSLKIVINGSFGKFGSQYSCLYSPDLMIATTITGQLALLMLIEAVENIGISVVSGNTDGFVSLMGVGQHDEFEEVCAEWERKTGYDLEATEYKGLYSRDVNNYLAVYEGGSKGKGIFRINALDKSPQAQICAIAVQKLLCEGIPIRQTILECEDIRDFINVRTVNGGAVFRDAYLGRVVRWIYSTDGDKIMYKKNGNKVPKSDGSRPVMTLGELPKDIDYERYIDEAILILDHIGLTTL